MLPIHKSQITYLDNIKRRALYFMKGFVSEGLDANYEDVVGILSETTVKCEKTYIEDEVHEAALKTYVDSGQKNAMRRYRRRLGLQRKYQYESPSVTPDETFLACMMNEAYRSGNSTERNVWLQMIRPCGAVMELMGGMKSDCSNRNKQTRAIAEYYELPIREVAGAINKLKNILEDGCEYQ